MRKYVFNMRADPVYGPRANCFMDVTELAALGSEAALKKLEEVTKRIDPDGDHSHIADLNGKLRTLAFGLGSIGDMRRRMNTHETPYMCVNWDEDYELTPEMLDGYVQSMTPERREAFYKEARL